MRTIRGGVLGAILVMVLLVLLAAGCGDGGKPVIRIHAPQNDSQSLNNAIYLKEDAEAVTKKVMRMFTDPTRLRATDPGHVEGNPVFAYHDAFNPDTAEVQDLKDRYVAGKVGDVEVKQKLAAALNTMLDPIRERRAYYEARPDMVREALASGSAHARKIAQQTMAEVREALKLTKLGPQDRSGAS